jgi:hypothetical protein
VAGTLFSVRPKDCHQGDLQEGLLYWYASATTSESLTLISTLVLYATDC